MAIEPAIVSSYRLRCGTLVGGMLVLEPGRFQFIITLTWNRTRASAWLVTFKSTFKYFALKKLNIKYFKEHQIMDSKDQQQVKTPMVYICGGKQFGYSYLLVPITFVTTNKLSFK